MIAISNTFIDRLLELAAEVERDECRIKQELLRAARGGDVASVERIAERWLRLPSHEVLAETSQKASKNP